MVGKSPSPSGASKPYEARTTMRIETDPDAATKLASYPAHVQPRVAELRTLIIEAAREAGIPVLVETLKWGEPSYLAKNGSTLRFDWKERAPGRVSLYFKCTSTLIPTIRAVYGDLFDYEANRAIHLDLEGIIPRAELTQCIRMALCYHVLKDKPLLGYGQSPDGVTRTEPQAD